MSQFPYTLNGCLLKTVFLLILLIWLGEWVHRSHAAILEVGVLKLVTFERPVFVKVGRNSATDKNSKDDNEVKAKARNHSLDVLLQIE